MTQQSRSHFVNALTFARVPLIFAWAILAILHEFTRTPGTCGQIVLACIAGLAMLLSGLTDLWDGRLARKWNVVSTLGKMADPLMDKVFYIVAFPVLLWQTLFQDPHGAHGLALLGFTVLYVLRDTWVTFMRSIGTMYGADVAAMWLGKVRTAISFPGAGWIYVYLVFHPVVPPCWQLSWLVSCYVVEGFLGALTIWSLGTYTRAYLPYLRRALRH